MCACARFVGRRVGTVRVCVPRACVLARVCVFRLFLFGYRVQDVKSNNDLLQEVLTYFCINLRR